MTFEAAFRAPGELPEWATLGQGLSGSFDCVAGRFAHDNFAQDDRGFWAHDNFAQDDKL